jgi:hypothetical protein
MPYSGKKWALGAAGPDNNIQRGDTEANHPSSARVILGHSNEGLSEDVKSVIVPPGTIIVVKSHAGDVRMIKDIITDLRRLLNRRNTEFLLDPVKYIDKITEFFGSVALYREGDVCPNFVNTRIISVRSVEGDGVVLYPSGVVKLPLKEEFTNPAIFAVINGRVKIPNTMTLDQYFEQRGRPGGIDLLSVLKLSTFSDVLEEDLTEERKRDGNKLLIDYLSELEMDLTTDIDKLLKKATEPAVYYFFTCRFIDGRERLVPESVRLGTDNTHGIITETTGVANDTYLQEHVAYVKQGPNNSRNTATRRARVSRIAPEIQQQISESVLQRRQGAKAYARLNQTRKGRVINAYREELTHREIHRAKIARLKQFYPDIEKEFIDDMVLRETRNMPDFVRDDLITSLREVADSYPERRANIDAAIRRYTSE